MVYIKGFNSKGELVWSAVLTMETYNQNRTARDNDAKQHGAVRVLVDMAL